MPRETDIRKTSVGSGANSGPLATSGPFLPGFNLGADITGGLNVPPAETPVPTPSEGGGQPRPTPQPIPFDSVSFTKRLEEAKTQALEIQKGVTELRERERISAADIGAGVISSSDAAISDRDRVDGDINVLAGPREVDTSGRKLLEELIGGLQARETAETAAIEKQFATEAKKQDVAQERETATVRTGLVSAGGFLGFSGSGTGVLLSLAQIHKDEDDALIAKKDTAISAAKKAISLEKMTLARELVNEIRSIDDEIDKRRNTFFDQTLKSLDFQRKETAAIDSANSKLRDDARASINSMLSNFGGFDLANMDEDLIAEIEQLAAIAGMPIESITGPTIKQTTAERTAKNEAIRIGISQASLSLSQARFEEQGKLSALEAQRLELPRTVVGEDEDVINAQLQNSNAPLWFLNAENEKAVPIESEEDLQNKWDKFRNEVLTTSSLFDFGGLPPVTPTE